MRSERTDGRAGGRGSPAIQKKEKYHNSSVPESNVGSIEERKEEDENFWEKLFLDLSAETCTDGSVRKVCSGHCESTFIQWKISLGLCELTKSSGTSRTTKRVHEPRSHSC